MTIDEEYEPRGSRRLLDEVQALARLGIWEWSLASNQLYWSDELYRILGLSPGAIAPSFEALLARVHPDDLASVEHFFARARGERGTLELEYRIVRTTGEIRTLQTRARSTFDETGGLARIVGTDRDITGAGDLEARLVASDRMASVGTLASSVAHEINNPLATLALHLALLEERPTPRADEAMLGEARAAVERIRDVVRGLVAFARADEDRGTASSPGGELAGPPHVPPPVRAIEQRGRVLIVDDEVAFARALRRLLASEHDVDMVTSGRDALARLRTGERFDAILCDLMMPEMTGADLHVALSDLAPDQAERIIFVTGNAFSTTSQHFLENITNLCFEKPCDLQELRAAVRQRVAGRS